MDDNEVDTHAWMVFQHSTDTISLRTALNWMSKVLAREPEWANGVDTYANLLYKLGDIAGSLVLEEKAAKLAPKHPDIQSNLLKMRNGEPTWPSK